MGIIPIIKHAVNSTLGTGFFMSLDKMISSDAGTEDMVPLNEVINALWGGYAVFRESGTFKVPPNVKKLTIIAAGGGGAGGGIENLTGNPGCGGGSGGECCEKEFTVEPEQIIQFDIGKGGVHSTKSGQKGGDGGATVVHGFLTAAGGIGAYGNSAGAESVGEGSGKGGNGSTSDSSAQEGEKGLFGAGGGVASKVATSGFGGGGGGSYGKGGDGGKTHGNGENGVDGGGGGGAGYRGSIDNYGGDGGDGIVIFKWGV